MLDKDLAKLYDVSTGNLNKAVSRNLKRFPQDFMFHLNEDEFKNLMFQNGISSWGGTRKMPYCVLRSLRDMKLNLYPPENPNSNVVQVTGVVVCFRARVSDVIERFE